MFGHLIGHLMNDPLDDLSDQHDGLLEAPKVNDLEKHFLNTPDSLKRLWGESIWSTPDIFFFFAFLNIWSTPDFFL